jgi:hypothetical protein
VNARFAKTPTFGFGESAPNAFGEYKLMIKIISAINSVTTPEQNHNHRFDDGSSDGGSFFPLHRKINGNENSKITIPLITGK